MIEFSNVEKKYGDTLVWKDLNFRMEKGFCVLSGASGSGKTSVLNILSGLTDFPHGTVTVLDREFRSLVDSEYMGAVSDYLTQDAFFVDYLSVADNLRMAENNDEKIKYALNKVGLFNKYDQFPPTLSGGERQRLAIARFLMKDKALLILDEPTAALDEKNKIDVFALLKEIGKEKLVICATHDEQALDFADFVLEFDKKTKKPIFENLKEGTLQAGRNLPHGTGRLPNEKAVGVNSTVTTVKRCSAGYFLKKWFISRNRSKKSDVLFVLFVFLAMCVCLLADTPTGKLYSNMKYFYEINMCMVSSGNEEMPQILESDSLVEEVVLEYNSSIPRLIHEENEDGVMEQLEDDGYDQVDTLPFDKELTRMSGRVKYGTYFTDVNQIILKMEKAVEMNPSNPENLIGQTVELNFYGKGKVELEIVGIFDEENEIDTKYFSVMQTATDWFVNSKLMEDYLNDPTFTNGVRTYYVFFKSFTNLETFTKKFSEEHEAENIIVGNVIGSDIFTILSWVFLPVAFMMLIFTVVFYTTICRVEISYNRSIFAVFDYMNYSIKQVNKTFVLINLMNMLKKCLCSMAAACVFTILFNFANKKLIFIPFMVFTYNIWVITAFIVTLGISSVASNAIMLKKLGRLTWYENLTSARDIL